MAEDGYDAAVIGAGVVGAAIARELSRYELRCVLIEAADDVGTGTSKANTAIRHTGFDARPGTLEASLLARGFPLLSDFAAEAGIPLETTGALLVAWDEAQLAGLDDVAARARANGYTAIRPLTAAQVYAAEPNLGPGVRGGLLIPDEGILCPFTTPLALAADALAGGVRLLLGSPVTGIRSDGDRHLVTTPAQTISTRWVINAAGLRSDTIDSLLGHHSFTITPRRGELVVFDKLARRLISRVILPVPTSRTKGVLVAPTVFGNVLVGPTAEDVGDTTATQTTAAGLASLLEKGQRIVPGLAGEEVTACYAGLRAATGQPDYQISCHPEQRYVAVGGIRSTGLSACLGIAAHVLDLLADAGLKLRPGPPRPAVRMPPIGEAHGRPYRDEAAIAANPSCGEIVCFCERVTRAEIVAAASAPIPARTLDGLRRRTRAMLGRCQGFYCSARVTALLAEATGQSTARLLGLDEEG